MRLVITASRALRAWRETTACPLPPSPSRWAYLYFNLSVLSLPLFLPLFAVEPRQEITPIQPRTQTPITHSLTHSHTHSHTQRHALNINISSALDSSEIYSAAKPAENWLVSWRQAIDTLPLGELGRQREGWMERERKRERVRVCMYEKAKERERESQRKTRDPPLQDNVISSVGNGDE